MVEIHQLPGRLRVRSQKLKGNAVLASLVRDTVENLKGVNSASVNALTGSLLVVYDINATHAASILKELRSLRILTNILGFPGPSLVRSRSATFAKEKTALTSFPSLNEKQKKYLTDLCLFAGKVFLAALVEQTSTHVAKAFANKILFIK